MEARLEARLETEASFVDVEGSACGVNKGDLTVLVIQSIRGLTRSSQGIPRTIEWSPMGATRNVSR